jgi:hypothetical protein
MIGKDSFVKLMENMERRALAVQTNTLRQQHGLNRGYTGAAGGESGLAQANTAVAV